LEEMEDGRAKTGDARDTEGVEYVGTAEKSINY